MIHINPTNVRSVRRVSSFIPMGSEKFAGQLLTKRWLEESNHDCEGHICCSYCWGVWDYYLPHRGVHCNLPMVATNKETAETLCSASKPMVCSDFGEKLVCSQTSEGSNIRLPLIWLFFVDHPGPGRLGWVQHFHSARKDWPNLHRLGRSLLVNTLDGGLLWINTDSLLRWRPHASSQNADSS